MAYVCPAVFELEYVHSSEKTWQSQQTQKLMLTFGSEGRQVVGLHIQQHRSTAYSWSGWHGSFQTVDQSHFAVEVSWKGHAARKLTKMDINIVNSNTYLMCVNREWIFLKARMVTQLPTRRMILDGHCAADHHWCFL
jgi:hypothetical protein